MMKQIKKILHKIFRLSGRDFLPYTYENFYSLRRLKIIDNENINVVLDVGAHNGAYGKNLREDGYSKRIISFEPLNEAFQFLKQKADSDMYWECQHLALGDSIGKTTINVSGHLTSSSILPITDRHVDASPSSGTITTQEINVATLDSLSEKIIKPEDKIFMKVDVQGYEKHVLNGAKNTLNQIHVIELELSFSKMYEGGPLFSEMLSFLDQLGFSLVAINQVFSDPATGHMLQADGVFIRK